MKHIRLFETQADRDATPMEGPFIAYTKETDTLEIEGVTPISKLNNPKLMQVVYDAGLAAHPDYMTLEECRAVTNTQMSALKGTASANSQFAGVTDFDAFKYFTSVTSVPGWQFRGANFTKISFPDSITSIAAWAFNNSVVIGTLDLSSTKITVLPRLYNASSGYTNNRITGIILPDTCATLGDGGQGVFDTGNAPRTPNVKFCVMPYNGVVNTGQNSIGNISPIRFYVPDEWVEVYQTKTTASGYHTWKNITSKIYPISQFQEDIDNGVISV